MNGLHSMREAVMNEARLWLGTPYRHQASRKGVGCDCLGLVLGIWRALYGRAPEEPGPYAPDWAAQGRDRMLHAARRHMREIPVEDAEPGDLLLFRWRPSLACHHAGIRMPEERFAHAYQGSAVVLSALVPQWRRRIGAAFLFPAR